MFCTRVSIALVTFLALPYWAGAQGRQQAAQAAAQAVPGRGGRGGMGPAVGGEIDETPAVTHHTVQVDGQAVKYTATAAQMPLKTTSGETEAHMFYVAYTLDGASQTAGFGIDSSGNLTAGTATANVTPYVIHVTANDGSLAPNASADATGTFTITVTLNN